VKNVKPGNLDQGLALEVEAASSGELKQSAVLLMRPDRLPRAVVTDERGVVHSRVISYVDLLATLDGSTVIDQLEREPTRRLSLPPLPPGTLLLDVIECSTETSYVITGVLPIGVHLFTLERGLPPEVSTYRLALPPVVYRALYHEKRRCVTEFSVALLSPDLEGEPAPGTETFRWPFSNVYSTFQGIVEGVCWHRKEQIELSLREIPEKLVRRFLSIPNEADRYSRDLTHTSPHEGYEELLEAIEKGGGIPHEWLVPSGLTVRELHEQKGRKD
jgi:hypothetical protein